MQKSLRVRGATVKCRKPRGLHFSKALFAGLIFVYLMAIFQVQAPGELIFGGTI